MFDVDKLSPIGPNVLVKRMPVAEKTASGIALPEAQIEKNLRCRVLKVGSGEFVNGTFVHSGLVPGDIVIIRQFDGRKLTLDKTVLLVHHELIEAQEVNEPWAFDIGGTEDGGRQCS